MNNQQAQAEFARLCWYKDINGIRTHIRYYPFLAPAASDFINKHDRDKERLEKQLEEANK